MNESGRYYMYIHVKTEFLRRPSVAQFSARFLAIPRRGRYYNQVKTEFLACPWVNFNAV